MRRSLMIAAAVAIAVGQSSVAMAKPVGACYKAVVSTVTTVAVTYLTEPDGKVVAKDRFGYPQQSVYAVTGREFIDILDASLLEPIYGSILVIKAQDSSFNFASAAALYNCSSDEPSTTPAEWKCEVTNLSSTAGVTARNVNFVRADPAIEELCSAVP